MSRKAFLAELIKKLDQGAKEYGERSFERPERELLEELQLECLDLAGWGYILWERIERVKNKTAVTLRCDVCGLTPIQAAGRPCDPVRGSTHCWRKQ